MDHTKKLQEESSVEQTDIFPDDLFHPIKAVTVDTWNYVLPLIVSLMLTLKLSFLNLLDETTGSNTKSQELISLHARSSEHNSHIPESFLDGFYKLPQEVLAQIFSELSASDIKNISLTCCRFNKIAKNYRRQLPVQILDSLDFYYSGDGNHEFFQSGSSDSLGILPDQRKKKYVGENPFDILQYQFFQVSCSLEAIDEELIQILRLDRMQTGRIDFRLNFIENDAAIPLVKKIILHIQQNVSIRKAVFRTSKYMTQLRHTLKEATQSPGNKLIVY